MFTIYLLMFTMYLDREVGNHCKNVDVSAIAKSLRRDYCDALLGFYLFKLVMTAPVPLKTRAK